MAGNVRKRANAPKYTTGLGDGHVEGQADTDLQVEAGNPLLQKVQSLRARNNNKHHIVVKGGEQWLDRHKLDTPDGNLEFGVPENRYKVVHSDDPAMIGKNQHQRFHHKAQRHDRAIREFLETPFMVLGAAVFIIMVSAVFIHLISSGGNQEARKSLHGRTLKKKTSRPHSRIQKKKTDEWNEDAEEDYLLSESVRNGGSTEVDDTKAVYYPYQPRLQQQHRHRKNSSNSQAGVVVVPQANQQASVQHRNYYLNQSGAVIGAFGPSNVQKSPGQGAPLQTPAKSSSSRTLGAIYSPDVYNSARPQSARDLSLSYPSLQQPQEVHLTPHQQQDMMYPTTGIVARPLSTKAESFESLTRSYGDESQDYADSLFGASFSPQRSPCVSSGQQQKFTVLGSPKPTSSIDHDDAGTPKFSHGRYADLVDKTPRIANGRPVLALNTMQPSVPEHSPLLVREYQHRSSDDNSVDLLFAAPLDMRSRNQQQRKMADGEPSIMPFVPTLDVHVARTRPPRSMNMDDLHLYQKMESGDVSHWEAYVADETRQLEEHAFPEPISDDVQTAIIESAACSSATANSQENSIPSDDPRKGIQHKRKDLTDATDASASLQGTIDFDELKLVEVIGGGGFGQVWKAVWRGTPVAVKVLTGSAQSKSVPRAVLEEFVAEINLLRGMRHPNICLYMGACLKPPNRAIITELAANGSLWDALRLPLAPPYVPCDGLTREGWPMSLYQPDSKYGTPPARSKSGSLSSVPPRGTWHWILVKRVACGAARGMAYLHSGTPPILHRDLKSANILLDDSYTAKVCDFGLSRIRAQESSMTGNVGTVQWMPPEVLANQSYNEKADVYSYGIICWELLTRECPYDKMTPIQCALAVLNRNQRPEIPKWCPPALQALIRSCIKKDPDERPSFTDILDALDTMP